MAYKTEELHAQAMTAITKNRLIFIEEVVAFLPCDKTTFYNHKLHESNDLKEAILKNKVEIKSSLRAKWYKSDNATKQLALYKLIGTKEEAHRLNGTRQEIELSGEVKTQTFDIGGQSIEFGQ